MADVSRFLRLKQIPDYCRATWDYEVSRSTIHRWNQACKPKDRITFPTFPAEFDPWFERRVMELAVRYSSRIYHSAGFHKPRRGDSLKRNPAVRHRPPADRGTPG